MAVVTSDHAQRFRALASADHVRLNGVAVREGLSRLSPAHAKQEVAALLLSADERVARMPVYRLLLAVPQLGDDRLRVVCEGAGVWPLSRIGELSMPQRRRLALALVPSGRQRPRSHKGRCYVLSEDLIARSHSWYLDGMSASEIADRLIADWGVVSASAESLSKILLRCWRARDWEIRSCSEARRLVLGRRLGRSGSEAA